MSVGWGDVGSGRRYMTRLHVYVCDVDVVLLQLICGDVGMSGPGWINGVDDALAGRRDVLDASSHRAPSGSGRPDLIRPYLLTSSSQWHRHK